MALTILQGKNNVSVLMDGTTAFDISGTVGTGPASPLAWVRLCSIQYYAAGAGNILTVRDKSLTGVQICKMKDVTPAGVHREFTPHRCTPVIVGNEATSGDLVIFEFV